MTKAGPDLFAARPRNFEKFLVNRKGEVVGRFAPAMGPADPAILSAIDAELSKPA